MASINTNRVFAEKKANTVAPVKIPKNVKQALGISAALDNGIFRIEPIEGSPMYDQCYLFEDINYINKDREKKNSVLLELMKLFRSMAGQYKITIACEQQDMDEFMNKIFAPIHGNEYPTAEEGMRAWFNQKIDEGSRDIRRILLLTVTCRATSFEEARAYFTTLDTTLAQIFMSLGSRLHRLDAYERLAIIKNMVRAGKQGIEPYNVNDKNDSWKNQVMPSSIHQDTDYMVIDNSKYVTVLFGHDYSQTLDEEKLLHSLSDVMFQTYITIDLQRVPKKIVKDRLMVAHANNEKLISMERTRNYNNKQYGASTSYTLEKKKEDIECDLDQVNDNDEEGIFLGLLVYVIADSLDELIYRVEALKQKASDFTLEPFNHRQLKAFNTVLPIGGRQVNHMRFLYSSSAVAFQPFYASDLQDPNGVVYGLNVTTKHLLRGDRKLLPAPHGAIIGHSGSGKSFFIKTTEITQPLLCTNDDIMILDPNNEQEMYIKSLPGAQYFDFTPQAKIYMNPFEIPEYVRKGNLVTRDKFVAKMVEFSGSLCAAAMKGMDFTNIHMTYVEEAVREMYEDYFNSKNPLKKEPTMTIFRERLGELKNQPGLNVEHQKMIEDMYTCMKLYTVGVYDMFAHPTNLSLDSRVIGFGLINIPESVWEIAMLAIMHFLSMRIAFNQEEKVALHLVVDEAQVLCEKETTAEQLLYAVETYRKVGAIVTLAAQNLTRFLENPRMRDMFSNCPYKVFFDQGGIDAANLAEIQELSNIEFKALSSSAVGCGLMVWGTQVFLFDGVMNKTNPLYPYFNTNFHEKAQEKN